MLRVQGLAKLGRRSVIPRLSGARAQRRGTCGHQLGEKRCRAAGERAPRWVTAKHSE